MLKDTLRAFCDALLDPLAVVDPDDRLIMANPALRDLLGYTAEDADRLTLAMLLPEHRRTDASDRLDACRRGEKTVAVPWELEARNARPIPVFMTLSPFNTKGSDKTMVALTFKTEPLRKPSLEQLNLILERKVESQDLALDRTVSALEAEVSERHGVENELRLSRRQLHLLSRKTLELLENDRQVIAKELHDSIGASLAAIKFSLEGWMEVYGDRLPSPEIPFDRIIAHIVETIKETKRISANLRPSTLDDLGFLATAKWFCRDLSGLYVDLRIVPRFEVDEADIPEASKIVLYRVMQEALNNAAKHSGAGEVHVTLTRSDRYLEMTVDDNGRGFELERVMENEDALSGFGINSMRERVEISNGCFDIRTAPGEGTHLRVLLPMQFEEVEGPL